GNDVIEDKGSTYQIDRVVFKPGVANTDVRFYVSGEDLLVRLVGSSTDSILIKRWFDTSDLRYGYKIEEFVFEDGVRLTAADVEAGTVLDGTPGDDSISGRG